MNDHFRQTAELAASKAGLDPKQFTVAVNAFRLIAHAIAEHGQLKLPHGAFDILSDVSKQYLGLRIASGSLRWYRNSMMKDPKMVAKLVDLPEAYLLVREAALSTASC